MTQIIDLAVERAMRRPTIYADLDEALADALHRLEQFSDTASHVLLVDSEDVLQLNADIHAILSVCRSHNATFNSAKDNT